MSTLLSTTPCPRCGRPIYRSPGEERPPYCDAVSCGYELPALERERELPARPGVVEEPGIPVLPPPPQPEAALGMPRLVAPHECQVCHGPIDAPIGTRRKTLTHDPLGCRTDIFAILFRAPCCSAYLEMPLRLGGQQVTCPACRQELTGPYDGILHRLTGDVHRGEVMRFPCPECRFVLQCNTAINGRPTPGLPVACLTCLHVFPVPSAGDAVRRV